MMHSTRREALLNSVRSPEPIKANLDVNFVHTSGRLLRLAVARTGLSHKEAMDALGVEHKSEFSEMLDGKRKLWMHQLLRPEAQPIWKELIFVAAQSIPGMTVERVVRLVEHA
jgi:hypothetical protein